ncbi:MAG: aspartate--ammonia ligase [Candidatus Micrarchaeota archaeon]|nr:aspartate--ammonia ligase [Candidatus Micrarchaeota archaeon]
MELTIPKNYRPMHDVRTTEKAIKQIKRFFEADLSNRLNLERVSAPLFVTSGTGINDNLNGVEMPVSFSIRDLTDICNKAEIVQSLAKWKRMMLAKYGFYIGEGLYTDMNALRPDEPVLDNLHSIYVDQWDWERVISPDQRNIAFLEFIVMKIYGSIRSTELMMEQNFKVAPALPNDIFFIHTEELEEMWPNLSRKERENRIVKDKEAVFIIGIGNNLKDGKPHDGRAPDYDDWTTLGENGKPGLNGDIVVWNPVLDMAFELSSMGIRVNRESLLRQLEITGTLERKNLLFHSMLLKDHLPLSIGGGIGQSRLCMLMLRKAHVGEVQVSIWPERMVSECNSSNIPLL